MADTIRPFAQILVPTDLGKGAEQAVARVPWLPLAADARIVLLHCVAARADAAADGTRELLDQAAGRLEQACKTRSGRVRVEPLLVEGKPFRAILELAEEMRPELVVLGRHRRRPGSDWLGIGTTVDRVCRGTRVPVLLVRKAARRGYASFLAALDRPPSLAATRALQAALRLTPQRERAVALHAMDEEISTQAKGRPGVKPEKMEAWREQRRKPALDELRQWLSDHHADTDWHLIVSTAEPVRTLIRAAKAQGVDLVALGTNSRTAVERWLLGSIAESLLRKADCDVLVASDR